MQPAKQKIYKGQKQGVLIEEIRSDSFAVYIGIHVECVAGSQANLHSLYSDAMCQSTSQYTPNLTFIIKELQIEQ